MKKIYFLLSLSFAASLAHATIHTVTVTPSSFSPAIVNAVCLDTVVWVLGSGLHTTTSTTIPACAAPWDAPINTTTPSYTITVPCVGNYDYKCTPHGFTGLIKVVCLGPNEVSSININYLSSVYPNPFSNKFTIEISDADMIILYNMLGEKIKTAALQHKQIKTEINAADLREGIYSYCIIKEGVVIETRKIVKD